MMDRTIPLVLPWDETFDIGLKTGTPIDDTDYQVPFVFNGKIDKLTISLDPPKLTAADEQKLSDAYRAAQDAN
jgi:arylsulfatase